MVMNLVNDLMLCIVNLLVKPIVLFCFGSESFCCCMSQKKERLLKRKHREDMLLNDLKKSCIVGITRTCRIRAPVNYTFGIE